MTPQLPRPFAELFATPPLFYAAGHSLCKKVLAIKVSGDWGLTEDITALLSISTGLQFVNYGD